MLLSSNPNGVPDETPVHPLFTTGLTFVLGIPTGFVCQVRSGLLLMCFKRKKEKDLTVYSHCRQFALKTIRMILV
jgi:hypothetical protein